jgi:hypothetical protein
VIARGERATPRRAHRATERQRVMRRGT